MSHVDPVAVGRLAVRTICEGSAFLPLADELPGTQVDWAAEYVRYPWAFEGDAWPWHVHAFLVDAPEGLIAVDTGLGGFPPYVPWASQAADPWAGVDVAEVRHVVLTHLHADHAGGSVVDGEPRFPNARYWLHTMDRLHFAGADDAEEYVARSAADRLEELGMLTLSFEDVDVVPGLRLLHTPGHTPGHRSALLSDGGDALLLTGDTFHQPTQIRLPDRPSAHDEDEQLGIASRRLLLWKAAISGWRVGVPHFAEPFGVVRDGAWVAERPGPDPFG